jgi:outer membrane protein assembly factor BamB
MPSRLATLILEHVTKRGRGGIFSDAKSPLRWWFCTFFLILATPLCGHPMAMAQVAHGLVLGRSQVAEKGLQRAWFAQVQLDVSRDRMTHLLLNQGWLFAQTELGVIQAFDAETGVTIWSRMVGEPSHPTLPLAVNDRFVAVINGTTLYLLQRSDGRPAVSKEISGVPNAAPAMSPARVYIPTMRGLIESWELPLDEATSTELERERQRTQTPWRIHSAGRSETQLLVTPHSVCWPTDTGYIYVAELDARKVLFRVELTDHIVAPLGYRDPTLVAGGLGGFVWAVNETKGNVLWRFSTGYPIRKGPVIIDDQIYVCPQGHGMFCLDSTQGKQLWWAPNAAQFVAASSENVYASDPSKRLLILGAKTGNLRATLATEALPLQLTNQQTDRIYLGTRSGLIQCLHELALTEPIDHAPRPQEDQKQGETEPAEANQPGGDVAAPADAPGTAPAKPPGSPPAPAQAPGKEPPADPNPFGDG